MFFFCFIQATFFITYVLTSGWASLAIELIQICPLFWISFQRHILRCKDDSLAGPSSFPYHTETPRILLFLFLGFTCSILSPLITPFLLVYFFMGYIVYKNQVSTSFRFCLIEPLWSFLRLPFL